MRRATPEKPPVSIQYGGAVKALPGRPRRRKARRRPRGQLVCSNLPASLWLAVALWYSLGVLSIATSKLLLSSTDLPVRPLSLTLQQLLIGSTFLRFLLSVRFMGSSGLQAWPTAPSQSTFTSQSSEGGSRELLLAGICFSLGFLATNYGFAGSAASFVETVKAAEPITSASVAAWFGIEIVTLPQKMSLLTIVSGVLLSTLGHGSGVGASAQPVSTSIVSCATVMASNLCFSFRGLYQKLFRKHAPAQVLDDLNLQFRMQWMGVQVLFFPVVVLDVVPRLWFGKTPLAVVTDRGAILNYLMLATINGFAFTSYNLASTYILSRISVVHHAALNCIRRVFAIVVTSILFGVPITLLGGIGIGLAVVGFMAYTHYKMLQQQKKARDEDILLPINAKR